MHQYLVLEAPGLSISYDFEQQWLYVDWQGEHTQDSGRRGCELILSAISQWPTTKILNDNTHTTRTDVQLTAWGVSWLHDMYAAGLRYLAWVYAPNYQKRRASEQVMKQLDRPLIVGFDNREAARQWLREQKVSPLNP